MLGVNMTTKLRLVDTRARSEVGDAGINRDARSRDNHNPSLVLEEVLYILYRTYDHLRRRSLVGTFRQNTPTTARQTHLRIFILRTGRTAVVFKAKHGSCLTRSDMSYNLTTFLNEPPWLNGYY